MKSILCQAAWAATRTRGTRLSAFYYRLVKRRGPKKANMALAHLMLRIIYEMLKNHTPYMELGEDYLPKKERNLEYWIQQIQKQGPG
ncbi:hypothetical protein PAJ34TS1_30160 [Paenibacillus azoreducens]|uniref:IS110 family transposase n=1 Tax=Paenibacillus azoreducens TaxID=116718 RepID=A0A919YD91_9BACL|nr:hypothetical protein [Paenibacillus azoreducens]GIO47088.1 hypothetical protein J34TS1_18530 [Paenibacillus azoreducens]